MVLPAARLALKPAIGTSRSQLVSLLQHQKGRPSSLPLLSRNSPIRTYSRLSLSGANSSLNMSILTALNRSSGITSSIIKPPITSLLARQFSSDSSALPPFIARLEYIANGNPKSASAQYALYSACMRLGRPDYVVQRYRSNQFATNASSQKLYMKALGEIYGPEEAQAMASTKSDDFPPETLQSIGQAVGARSKSGLSLSKGGSGSKASPIHIMVEETWFNTIFKVVRFFAVFGFVIWASMVTLQLFLEGTGFVKKISGQQNSEVRPELQSTRFSDVHGCDEAKEELQELVDFLRAPDKFNTLGGKLPKGVLLVGPPGTGKTLLARAVAGEAGVPFFYMSGSEFEEVYVGVGAKRVRELFNAARAKAPAIVFIDELDAIGGKRNERDATYAKQTLNQLLTDLDGFDQNSGVIFLAATNFPELLDKALLRPGRFDRRVVVPLPDIRGRLAILKHHMKNIHVGPDVDISGLARTTPGLSGAELENIVNQAAVHASKNKAMTVEMPDFEWAKDKLTLGAERRSAIVPDKERLMTAYHEGGHALVAMYTTGAAPLYKATVMVRGGTLGITSFQMPETEQYSTEKHEYLASIDVCMGGKAAEEIVYGPDSVTSGAASDLQQATNLAYMMVTRFGMSDELGSIDLHSRYNDLSSDTKEKIWMEVKKILDNARDRATKLLIDRRGELDLLAVALAEYEYLDKTEMEQVVQGLPLPDKLKAGGFAPIKMRELLAPPVPTPALPSSQALASTSTPSTSGSASHSS